MKFFVFVSLTFLTFTSVCQEEENIVEIVDDLTITWDKEALDLSTYVGLQYYCATKPYRDNTIKLLDKIHHYDTLLYGIVKRKFEVDGNQEAEATLKDIEKLEAEYTTKDFKRFIHRECNGVNEIESNYGRAGGEEYDRETKKLEKELAKYVESITNRIDIIDEHIHHLKLD
ncbi:MAG: hypothetical protein ABJP45_08650 [Cyclobacteriaceae bacterium]